MKEMLKQFNMKNVVKKESTRITNHSKTLIDLIEGGVKVCGDAVLRYFWCGFAVIFILTRGIAVSKH